MTAMLETNEMLDIDLEIDIDAMPTDSDSAPEIRSWILCTGGCTSRGGGSFCSWCCSMHNEVWWRSGCHSSAPPHLIRFILSSRREKRSFLAGKI